jgi:hypothetical protein
MGVLHLYDSFYQKWNKIGAVTNQGLMNKWQKWKFKKWFVDFLGPLKINVFLEFSKVTQP